MLTLDTAQVNQRVRQQTADDQTYYGVITFIRRPNSANQVYVKWHKGYATWEDVSTLEAVE